MQVNRFSRVVQSASSARPSNVRHFASWARRRDQVTTRKATKGDPSSIKDHEIEFEQRYRTLAEQQQYERDLRTDEGLDAFPDPNKIEFGTRYNTPFVKPRNEPLPLYESPTPLLAWNQSKGLYQLREDKIQSEKTKQVLLSMHRRHPHLWSIANLCQTFGISKEDMYTIFWEDELGRRHKLWPDWDNVKRHEEYHGTEKIVESKAYTYNAYNEVTGDTSFMPESGKTPRIVPDDGLPDTIYHSWRKARKLPALRKDQWEIVPDEGTGSGKEVVQIACLQPKNPRPLTKPYMIRNYSHMYQKKWQPKSTIEVKVRERDGVLRYATLEEWDSVRRDELPQVQKAPLKNIAPPFGAGTIERVDGRLRGKAFKPRDSRTHVRDPVAYL